MTKTLRRRALCLTLPSIALFLAGCGAEAPANAAPVAQFAAQQVNVPAIKQNAGGFTVGQQMSANEVFVFFDPKCPHCAMLWQETEGLRRNIKFTWVPVAFMGPGSAGAGAEILATADKTQAMTAHAAKVMVSMRAGMRPEFPSDSTASAKHSEIIQRNTNLLTSFGANSIPYVVAVDGKGQIVFSGTGANSEKLSAALSLAPATK